MSPSLKCPHCLAIDPPHTVERRLDGFTRCHKCGVNSRSRDWVEIGEKPIIREAFAAIPGDVSDPIDLESFEDPNLVIFDTFNQTAPWAQRHAKDTGKSWRVVKITEVGIFK